MDSGESIAVILFVGSLLFLGGLCTLYILVESRMKLKKMVLDMEREKLKVQIVERKIETEMIDGVSFTPKQKTAVREFLRNNLSNALVPIGNLSLLPQAEWRRILQDHKDWLISIWSYFEERK